MADHVVGACRDCLPWVCRTNLRCTYEDPAFDYLREKILNCDGLVLGTPVYWWDTSAMVRYLFLKMFRVYASSAPTRGLPALGITVAGRYAYVASGSAGLQVVDVSNPANPQPVAGYETGGFAVAVAVSGASPAA